MNGFLVLILIVIAIAGLIFVPLGVIWSLNLLFGLNIAYSLATWFAALLLSVVVAGNRTSK